MGVDHMHLILNDQEMVLAWPWFGKQYIASLDGTICGGKAGLPGAINPAHGI